MVRKVIVGAEFFLPISTKTARILEGSAYNTFVTGGHFGDFIVDRKEF